MATSTPVQNATPSKPADDFGEGLFDQPVVRPAARPAAEQTRAPSRTPAPATVERKADEDDGFGAGLV